jgi:pimeloyl-ACP methyl ester carboxylesterase
LCDTKAEADTPQGKQGRDELAALAEREGMAPVVERLLPKLLGRTTQSRDLELVETVRAMVLRSPVTGVGGALRAMRDRPDSNALLGEIRVPTLVMGGAEDELTPPTVMEPMARRIQGARYVEVPSAGHLCPLERPDAVNEVLRDFLTSL